MAADLNDLDFVNAVFLLATEYGEVEQQSPGIFKLKTYDTKNPDVLFTLVPLTENYPTAAAQTNDTFQALVARFERAHFMGIKVPAITLQVNDGPISRLRLYRATHKSSRPGSIVILNAANDEFLGRISRDDGLISLRNLNDSVRHSILEALRNFQEQPQHVATHFGRRTGKCCFCGHVLVESSSVDLGYGPICAEKWGLPHGQNNTNEHIPSSDEFNRALNLNAFNE